MSSPYIHHRNKYPEFSHYDTRFIYDITCDGKVCWAFSKTPVKAPTYYLNFEDFKFYFEHSHPKNCRKSRCVREIKVCDKRLRHLYQQLKTERNILEQRIARKEDPKKRERLNLVVRAILETANSLKYHQVLLKK